MKPKIIAIPVLLLVVVLGAAYWYKHAAGTGKAAGGPPAVPVTASIAEERDIPLLLEVVGRAEAYESVTLKARVDGQVASVAYTEGQHVKSGDVLVRLDPSDFEARLKQAEAMLAKDEAQMQKARADLVRYVSLKERGFVSDEKVNEFRTAEAAASATVAADRAAVDLARLQLSYATVRAPIAGVVGARLVFPGSAVKVNDTTLAVVNRVKPLYVTFAVPEKHIPTLRQSLKGGHLTAIMSVPANKSQQLEGRVVFIDNAVDSATGTIQMKALLDNVDEKWTPGQFLNVSLTLDTLRKTVVVPTESLQQGPDGNFVFVIKPDNTVTVRKVALTTSFAGVAAIGQGLSVGERVVTDGQLRLTQGTPVQVKEPVAARAADSAPAAK